MEQEDDSMKHGKPVMKMGDVVCYQDQAYRVGTCMTSTSIELVELNAPTRGHWVGRDQVYPAQRASHNASDRVSSAPF